MNAQWSYEPDQNSFPLVNDFPDAKKLPEYSDYYNSPTKVNASVFITQALEDNWDGVQQSDIYVEYIATRGWNSKC